MSDRLASTVVSIVPFAINEYKPGLFPPNFSIPKSEGFDDPKCLVVQPSYFYVPVVDHPQNSFRVEVNSEKLAASIVLDFLNSQLARNTDDDAEPGLFWISEPVSPAIVKAKYLKLLTEAKERQNRWFISLVTMADDDYEKTRRHETISDFQRHAARALNLDRPWLIDVESIRRTESKDCPVCTGQVPVNAIICPICRAILDEQKYKQFSFAA